MPHTSEGGWPEGTWLYAGFDVAENRDGSFVVTRRFLGGAGAALMRDFVWWHRTQQTVTTVHGDKPSFLYHDETTSKIYPVAATDTPFAFADLGL